MLSKLNQKYFWKTRFSVKKLKILYLSDHTILFKFHQHVVQTHIKQWMMGLKLWNVPLRYRGSGYFTVATNSVHGNTWDEHNHLPLLINHLHPWLFQTVRATPFSFSLCCFLVGRLHLPIIHMFGRVSVLQPGLCPRILLASCYVFLSCAFWPLSVPPLLSSCYKTTDKMNYNKNCEYNKNILRV